MPLFSVRVDVFLHQADDGTGVLLRRILDHVLNLRTETMATMAELQAELQSVSTQVTKIGGETSLLLARIQELEDALAAGGVTTPEVDAALAALKEQVRIVDELVADSPA